ncbi:MAG: macro domain-containing protein [Actinomycetota bacterium]|nr:macro domain-containing protein [Actinomycetota bacterium]
MIKLRTGDLLESGAPAIGHGCNCAGVMGAGIARVIRQEFPHGYLDYRRACASRKFSPGFAQICPAETPGGPLLVNLATQDRPGPNAKLDWVRHSARDAVQQLTALGVQTLALPRIGCGIGGLDFDDVLTAIEAALNDYPSFTIEVWTLLLARIA